MQDYFAFALEWEVGWNSHDLDQIMAHYREDVVFRSRKAVPLTGDGEVRGHIALRSYWAAALENQPDLRFELVDVFEGYQMVAISYLNHHNAFAIETLYFDDDGKVYQAAACHRLERLS